jgi:hypothetical protein
VTQPNVDRAEYEYEFTSLCSQVAAFIHIGDSPHYAENRVDLKSPNLGPWQPDGAQDPGPGDPGGFGIDPCHGYEQCQHGVLFHRLMHGLTMDRMPVACYDRITGNPVSLYAFPAPPDRVLMPDGTTELPAFVAGSYGAYSYPALNQGASPYEAALFAYKARFVDHGIRSMRHAIVCAEYLQDKMAIDDLWMMTENWRYGDWSDRPDQKVTAGYPGEYLPPSLSLKLKQAAGSGMQELDRAFGWMMYAAACCVKYGRGNFSPWSWAMLELYDRASDAFGCVQNDASHPEAFAPGFTGTQLFHEDICVIGAHALVKQSGDPLPGALLTYGEAIYKRGNVFPYAEGPGQYGHMHWLATHENGTPTHVPVPDNASGEGGDPAHAVEALRILHELTGDITWLNLSLKHWHPHPTLAARRDWYAGLDEKAWCAYALAVLQAMPL